MAEETESKEQRRWNRYVDAINFCIGLGFYINVDESKSNDKYWNGKRKPNGNLKSIIVSYDGASKSITIPLKPRKYKKMEMLQLILEKFGLRSLKKISESPKISDFLDDEIE